jgi:hypothetical protein
LALQFIETLQLTHDGIDFVGPPNLIAIHDGRAMNDEYVRNHDRLTRANSLNFGGGVAFQLTERVSACIDSSNIQRHLNRPVFIASNRT